MEKNKVRPSDLEDQNHSEFENSTEGLIKTKNEETKQVMFTPFSQNSFTIPDSPHEHLESLQDSKDTFSEGSELDDEFTKDDKRLDIPTIEEIYKNQAEKRPSISDPEQITKLSKPKAASKVDMNSLRGFELSDSNFSHVKFFDVIRLSSVVDVDQSYDKLRESSKQLSYEEKKEEPQKEEPSIKIFGENDGDFEWVESKENSVAFIISPISFHRSDSIKDSYKYFKDDKEEIFEPLDEKEYEYNIETFATDLEFANKEKVFPLNINQPFFLKTRKGGITKFKIQMSEKKEDIHEVQTWILVRIRGSDKEHKVKPDIGYRLATIIDDKFYFLGRDPDDDSLRLWSKENDYGCTIEIKIWSNSEHEKNDRNQVQRLIFEDHPVLILDNESRVVSLCEQHTGEIELPPNYKGVSEIVATEHKSYKNISPRSWFQILHYKKEDILFIFTHLRLPKRSSAEYDYKSLCYTAEKAKINLSEEHIPFRVEPEENGIFLKTNTGFKLSFRPPGRAPLYLRSLPTQNSGVSKVIFTEYSPKHEEEFIFHFSRPFTDLNFRFSSDDKVAKLVKEWAYREEGSWQISTADYHKQLKKHISKMLLKHCAKEPNAQRKQKRELVCLNGWVDIQKITL